MKQYKQDGFVHAALIIGLVIALIGALGFIFWQNFIHKEADVIPLNTVVAQKPSGSTQPSTPSQQDPNAGYLVVPEWGLRFKVPSGLTDVRYKIFNSATTGTSDEELAIYAKPVDYNVTYVTNYESFSGMPTYALGILYRTTSATRENAGSTISGKKLSNYYYYTAWAFNRLASGAGCVALYGTSDADCQAEHAAFMLINSDSSSLLNTIDLAR